MQNIDVVEYLPQIMSELKKGILLNTKSGDKINTMTIAWGQTGITWGKMFFTIYVRHGRFTHKMLEESKEFTVSIPTSAENRKQYAKAISYIGLKTGRDINKFTEMNLTPVKGISVQSPAIKELPLTIECKIIYKQEQDVNNMPDYIKRDCYPQDIPSSDPITNRDFHTIYYGEIVNAYIL